ncbi:MAG: flavin reductase family protein [Deltaproteobacteria bacterium]
MSQHQTAQSAALARAFSQFTSGVTIVTAASGGATCGMTASSFTSLSVDPPLVLLCLGNATRTLDAVKRSQHFAVSVLAEHHSCLAQGFAGTAPERWAPFEHYDWRGGSTGAPVLEDSLAWFDCRLAATHQGGDHSIVVGEVVDFGSNPRARPLLYGNRTWRTVEQSPLSL